MFQGSNRFSADMGGRGGSPGEFGASASGGQRGGFGSEQDSGVLSSSIPGNVHSSRGFRRALMKSQARGNQLKDQLPDGNSFGGKGYKKPNYFAQGGGRHGMHMGAGAPFTGAANDTGSDFGG